MSEDISKETSRAGFRFVPQLLVNYLTNNTLEGRQSIQPASFFMCGVCLLVDISGFTRLSGEFCSRGKSGIDELQLATNGFLEKLVEIIYQFGGDIIKFAGDAIICVFSTDFTADDTRKSMCGFGAVGLEVSRNSNLPTETNSHSTISADVVLRVMHCANTLRAVQTEKLTVHVAMSCGEMCFGILGGVENRWECLISGPCMHELSNCLDDAASKEAVLSRDCALKLLEALPTVDTCLYEGSVITSTHGSYQFSIVQLPSDNFRIVSCDTQYVADSCLVPSVQGAHQRLQKQIALFVPLPIADELSTCDSLHSLAEIREVTTMFMKWDSYDADGKHRDLLELQACFYQAQRILHSTGAYLRQFLVDDKGCVLIGCWGMPHLSYLDNAHRALSAASQIKYELNKLDMTCSFGITTGDVYCGTVGSALRMEYAAIGSVVNMSARLMCKANGGILLDHATYSRLPQTSGKQLRSLDPMMVKGSDEPLCVYEYIPQPLGLEPSQKMVVQDHEISACCRRILMDVLLSVGTPTDTKALGVRSKPARAVSWITWLTRMTTARAAAVPTEGMVVVLVQGREGSGRSTVLNWLHAQAVEASLPVCYVTLSKKTAHVEYGLWRKVFQQLMPRDFYEHSMAQQREQALALLHKVFPNITRQACNVHLRVMQAVLGLNYGVPDQTPPARTHSISVVRSTHSARSMHSTRRGSKDGYLGTLNFGSLKLKPGTSSKRFQSLPIATTLFAIFAHLLQETPTLLIIGSVSWADESSLKLLQLICEISCRSAVVCSSVVDPDTQSPRDPTKFIHSAVQSDSSGSAHSNHCWGQHKATLLARRATIMITLENYTSAEIDRMLCAALHTDVVPPEISQLVLDFSGGSHFWVREMLQFIKDNGATQLLAAVGDGTNERRIQHETSSAMLNRPPSSRNLDNRTRTLSRTMSLRQPSMRQLPATVHQVQLDKLVLCRFENLSAETQRILRTAAIIGESFSATVLAALLPVHLTGLLADGLATLLNQKWLYQDTDHASLYEFAHPHAHQIIYELTPSSERAHQHQLVADFIVQVHGADETQYAALCYHYQHCDTDKALQYCAKAVTVLLDAADTIFDYADCVDLLQSTEPCCGTDTQICVLTELTKQLRFAIADYVATDVGFCKSILCKVVKNIAALLPSRAEQTVVPHGLVLQSPPASPMVGFTAGRFLTSPRMYTHDVSESAEQREQRLLLDRTNDLLSSLQE